MLIKNKISRILMILVAHIACAATGTDQMPEVFGTNYRHIYSLEASVSQSCEGEVKKAYDMGMHGMYVILPKNAVGQEEKAARACLAYLNVCEKYHLKCYISFSALEQACETQGLISTVRGALSGLFYGYTAGQSLWGQGEEADSALLTAVVKACAKHSAFSGVVLLERPEYWPSYFGGEDVCKKSIETLIQRVRALDPKVTICVPTALGALCSAHKVMQRFVESMNSKYGPVILNGHYFANFFGKGCDEKIARTASQCQGKVFVSSLHYRPQRSARDMARLRAPDDDLDEPTDRSNFLTTALRATVESGSSAGLFAFGGASGGLGLNEYTHVEREIALLHQRGLLAKAPKNIYGAI